MEPTVLVTASVMGLFSHRYSLMNITAPSGMTRKPIHLMRLVSECIISDCGCDPVCLASSVSRETKLSAPTAVSRARQLPDTTKLPESSRSPGFLTISSWNLKMASDTMYLHYNTIKYRYKKIEEISGLDLDRTEEKLSMELAVKIYLMNHI